MMLTVKWLHLTTSDAPPPTAQSQQGTNKAKTACSMDSFTCLLLPFSQTKEKPGFDIQTKQTTKTSSHFPQWNQRGMGVKGSSI